MQIGPVKVGSDHPVALQTMTTTDTRDVQATIDQVCHPVLAGCVLCGSHTVFLQLQQPSTIQCRTQWSCDICILGCFVTQTPSLPCGCCRAVAQALCCLICLLALEIAWSAQGPGTFNRSAGHMTGMTLSDT